MVRTTRWFGFMGMRDMEFEKKKFKQMFPNLANEMETSENRVAISSVRSDVAVGEQRASGKRFDNYVPDVVDFIRRCDCEEQAVEIIDYLEKRGEITGEYAGRLRRQLRGKGVRSFGPKKGDDYYSRSE